MCINYTTMFILYRSHVYDAVELQSQKVKTSTTTEYEYALVNSSSKIPSTTKFSQDIKADTIKLQDDPAYVATNQFHDICH